MWKLLTSIIITQRLRFNYINTHLGGGQSVGSDTYEMTYIQYCGITYSYLHKKSFMFKIFSAAFSSLLINTDLVLPSEFLTENIQLKSYNLCFFIS